MDRRDFNDEHIPLGYLITFRTYGTWLHGDARGSVDRNHRRYLTPMLPASPRRAWLERKLLKQPPVRLDFQQRQAVENGISEACTHNRWDLKAINVRTNHVHCVITASCGSKKVRAAIKARATRSMRDSGCWRSDLSPWSRGGSRKFLWTEEELANAMTYVVEDQGEPL